MSSTFYRRDCLDRGRGSRGDDEEEVRGERSRGSSRNRSHSRPAVSRRTATEWTTYPSRKSSLHSEPSADPRLRNNVTAVFSKDETVHNGTLPMTSRPTPITNPFTAPDDTHHSNSNSRARSSTSGPSGNASTAPESLTPPVEALKTLFTTFSKEAYTAAFAQLREDGAKESLAKAKKIDQQNRRIGSAHGGFAAFIAQGEEDVKKAEKLLEEAKTRKEKAEQRASTTAIAAAARLIELTGAGNVAQAPQINREREDEKISQLEITISIAMQELAEVKKDLQQTKAGAQITSKRIETLSDSQKRDLKGVTSDVSEVHLGHGDLKNDIDTLRNETRPILLDLKLVKSELVDVRRWYNDLKSEFANARKDSKATIKNLETVKEAVSGLEESHKESNFSLASLQLLVYDLEKSREQSNSAPEDLKALRASFDELSLKLDNMIQRPEFVRLSSMVDILSEQQVPSRGFGEPEQTRLNQLEADLTNLKSHTQSFQNKVDTELVRNIRSRFSSIENVVLKLQTDVKDHVGVNGTQEQQGMAANPQAMVSLQNDFNTLKEELRVSVSAATSMLPGLRLAIDGHKANSHSIRALTQRYNNINTEELAQAMLRQLERMYPHASQTQASFDAVLKDITGIRVESHEGLTNFSNRVNANFLKVKEDIASLAATALKNDTEYREHWKRTIDDVKSQRDTLKSEIDRDLIELKQTQRAQYADVQARIDKIATTAANVNGITHDESTDSDEENTPIPAARNPFASNGAESHRKRKRTTRQESPELVFTDERAGSAPLRAKIPRKG
jgi:chromosome segregation ATPase